MVGHAKIMRVPAYPVHDLDNGGILSGQAKRRAIAVGAQAHHVGDLWHTRPSTSESQHVAIVDTK